MKRFNLLFAGIVANAIVGCGGGSGSATPSNPIAPTTPVPTVSLNIDSSRVAVGQSAKLTWSSTNATSCTASGAWAGTKENSGTISQVLSAPGSLTYTLTCTGAGGSANQSVLLTVAIPLQKTSYANAKQVGLEQIELPQAADTVQAYARADFKGSGAISLFTAKVMYKLETSTAATAEPSVFAFWTKSANGSWVKEDAMIDSTVGCVHPRKAVVADFNNDGKPDVLVACQGYDGGQYAGEKMFLVLSTQSGVYHSTPLQDFVGFFHSVSAADLNGDGNVDFVAVDPNSPQALRMFMGKGDGTFTEAFDKFPAYVQNRDFYTVELVDVNGDNMLDMLVGGHDWQGDSKAAYIQGNGTANFNTAVVTVLPTVPDHGVVLDFLVANGSIYVDRTSGGGNAGFYQSKVIQKIDIASMRSSVPFIKLLSTAEPGEYYPWFPWLLKTGAGIQSDNVHLSTAIVE
ncbi:FG-GAP repeat domain-containing protein [Duganella sp. P38]|uniref:FG-GAP repeat domain-containing protein n=1 Tax=Duganella sp. P38 TaxID=3423949 RepID=UPI003D796C89